MFTSKAGTRPRLPLALLPLGLVLLACAISADLGATPTPAPGSTCDNAAYVTDVTIPDGTTIQPGSKFTKTWRLLNSGSCVWTTGYKLVFIGGDAMGGSSASVVAPVAPGSQTDISVELSAPGNNGTFKGNWQMQNASGVAFGSVVTVQIKVSGGSTPEPTSTIKTVTVSGTFNVAEVTLAFSNATSTPVVNYSANGYTFSVPSGWTGTITPTKGAPGNWSFDPPSWTFNNITSDQTRDFTAVPTTPTP
jgi:hypothetical protein